MKLIRWVVFYDFKEIKIVCADHFIINKILILLTIINDTFTFS